MKTVITITLTSLFFLSIGCGNLFAQTAPAAKSNLTAGPQSVANHAVTNPDILVVTGKIVDATNGHPIANAKINFDKFGEELLQASVDDKGNYALALNKKELGEPIRIVFKIGGYKRYAIKNIDKSKTYVDADIFLQPLESDEKSKASIKYIMNEDPFNTMVIKMQ